jgi:hypothetical protein
MGRRTRKRGGLTTRAERDAARQAPPAVRRRAGRERPQAPWGSFPLSELVILVGIGVMVWGFASGTGKGQERVAAGLVLASLGGAELALREHLAGYRSHSALLAGVAAFAIDTAIALTLGPVKVWVLLVVGATVFGGALYAMRELFKRRSGGLGFR